MSGYMHKDNKGVLWHGQFTKADNSNILQEKRKAENRVTNGYAGYLKDIRKNKTQKKMIVFDNKNQVKITIVHDTSTIIALKSYFGDEFVDRDGDLVLETGEQIKDLREKLKLNNELQRI